MRSYSLAHLSDSALLTELTTLVAQDRATTARLLAHLAEVDARKLYLPAAHPSMFSYCVHELKLSEDVACKRIQAARTARQFPAIFAALAEGRLHVTAVVTLAPHLTPGNADELLAVASHKSKPELEQLVAARFPRPDLPERIEAMSASRSFPLPSGQLAPERVKELQSAPGRIAPPAPPARLAPLSRERFALQVTIGQRTHEKLRYAQALLGHAVPSGEIAEVLDRALDALIERLERRKFAATEGPRPRPQRLSARPRYIPAEVKRAVWKRDGGRCTFVSERGQRCPARTRLEYDHADPIARGGRATAENLRLRCRAHNQFEAECAFGAGFMHEQRRAGRLRAAEARKCRKLAAESARPHPRAAVPPDPALDVTPWLRALGFRADEVRRAAEACEAMPDAPLEARVRHALSSLAPRARHVPAPIQSAVMMTT